VLTRPVSEAFKNIGTRRLGHSNCQALRDGPKPYKAKAWRHF
jgi:hypothetical protein